MHVGTLKMSQMQNNNRISESPVSQILKVEEAFKKATKVSTTALLTSLTYMAVGVGEGDISLRAVEVEKLGNITNHLSLGQNLHHQRYQHEGNKGFADWL